MIMNKVTKYFIKNCIKCKSEIKVTPKVYRKKEKLECDNCLNKMFKKFKRS
jgi:hypothetical protein